MNKNEIKEQENEEKNELKILTDKESYKEGEEIRISVLFSCSQEFENAKVKVSGIKTRYGYYISLEKTINLKKGENVIEFISRVPYCSINQNIKSVESRNIS